METTLRVATINVVLLSFFLVSSAETCSDHTFTSNRAFSSCNDLPHQNSHLYWNYIKSSGKLDIAYRASQDSQGWIAWGINPTATGMVGSQALIAFRKDDGEITAYSTPITSYSPSLQPGDLSFPVSNVSAEYSKSEMTIFAIIGPLSNGTTVNHVWQAGSSVSNNVPQVHPTSTANLESVGTLDFLSG